MRLIRRGARWTKQSGFAYLTFMSKILEHQHKSMHTACDIIVTLKVKFGDQNHDVRLDGIKVFLNTKTTKGIPARIMF